ncbi:hypothetical protein DL96DRAFT_1813693 [Flagelloscypha sp. PMI_526]|nr:hypothetical protein DL96DRAFT_1813693 [Flagelloscypha sp. PMI_526]
MSEPTRLSTPPPLEDGDTTLTAINPEDLPTHGSLDSSDTSLNTESTSTDPVSPDEEQALDSSEVLELQGFIDKKDWIMEKIKVLEQMPPIQVFVGLHSVKASSDVVDGLPSRDVLKQWLAEHDVIEKETEIFDTGELKKLRTFTRAATKRNLSPEDTDLIELTLTTIYELDKLLHLLRDRSENLDLLGTRISWEENRIAGWKESRAIVEDLQSFLEARGRWSPTVYETSMATAVNEEPSPVPAAGGKSLARRSSVTSLASMASASSHALTSASGAFSRTSRFKLAESLSRDAAQFSARVATLRHGKVNAAGKILDKLIDNSRKPVPDEILDEQDLLEEKLTEMDDINKFVMNITMQWRKADEIYVETVKDQNGAQALLDDIEDAKAQLPDSELSALFCSRAETFLKRLAMRGNPTTGSFPKPVHHLFPDQQGANTLITRILSDEIASARHLVAQAEREAKDYRASYKAVKRVQDILDQADVSLEVLQSVLNRLEHGVDSTEGDGSPLDLMDEGCLQPTRHSVFLALLPSIFEEADKHCKLAEEALRSSRPAILAVRALDLNVSFCDNAASRMQDLSELLQRVLSVREAVTGKANRLRESRKIWSSMEACLQQVSDLKRELGETMEQARWRQQCAIEGAPPTPESPQPVGLPGSSLNNGFDPSTASQMSNLDRMITESVRMPFQSLSPTLEQPLRTKFDDGITTLSDALNQVRKMATLLDSVKDQHSVMVAVQEDFHALQVRIEQANIRLEDAIEGISPPSADLSAAIETETALAAEVSSIRSDVKIFVDQLALKVPMVARSSNHTSGDKVTFAPKRFSSVDLRLGAHPTSNVIELPFDLHQLDDAVRNDCNTFALRVNGASQSLDHKVAQLHFVVLAADATRKLGAVEERLITASTELVTMQASFADILGQHEKVEAMRAFLDEFDTSCLATKSEVNILFQAPRTVLASMEIFKRDRSNISSSTLLAKSKDLKGLEMRFAEWNQLAEAVRSSVVDAREAELARIEQERLAEEARLAAEAAEKARLEKERLEEEARRQAEELRLEEERKMREEAERLAEQARMEEEKRRLEEEERRIMEEQRLEQERKAKEEAERLAAEAAEHARLEQERLDAEARALEDQKRAAEEERARQDAARLAAIEASRIEMEEKLRIAEEELAEERRLHQQRDLDLKKLRDAEEQRIKAQKSKAADKQRRGKGKEVATPIPSSPMETTAEDIFGLVVAPSSGYAEVSPELIELQNQIIDLRRRLRSLSINELVRPGSASSPVPSADQVAAVVDAFARLQDDVDTLPQSTESPTVTSELRSLRSDMQATAELLPHLYELVHFSSSVVCADGALSDLLEHVDSFPAAPTENLTSPHRSDPHASSHDQLTTRLAYTSSSVDEVSVKLIPVVHDSRAVREEARIRQTWSELHDMAQDRLLGKVSRPSSVVSSTRSVSRASSGATSRSSTRGGKHSKAGSYSALSLAHPRTNPSAPKRKPPTPSRRAVTGTPSSSTQLSTVSPGRSVSGSTLLQGTHASRQRTTSFTPSQKTGTPRRPSSSLSTRPRTSLSVKRSTSPASISTSSYTSSLGTFSRAPRLSTPARPSPRKAYVANPKSKLDMAVGDVVNKLPAHINVQADSWKDQSGKYWIGDTSVSQEPKLCFCRILRSQTVMVRVGGGWTELSKFIHNHFADSFRIVGESPPRFGGPSREEKWISSATLLQDQPSTILESPPEPPKTPEPSSRRIPSFSISSPSGASPRSLRSTPSSHGSPSTSNLTALQFMRRADDAELSSGPLGLLRPATPTRQTRARASVPNTPNRNSIWRP